MSIATESPHRDVHTIRNQALASVWHKSAPREVRKAFRTGHEQAGWKAWRRALRAENRRVVPSRTPGGRDQALTWGLAPDEIGALCLPPHAETDAHQTTDALRKWLRQAAGRDFKLDYALSALGWARRLPELADAIPAPAWWRLLDHLLHATAEAGPSGQLAEQEPLTHQLLAGELALTLAGLFPELTICRGLLPEARRTLSRGLADLLDGRGLPHARHFDQLHLLLACWTRCRTLGSRLARGSWSAEAEQQYGQLVRNALRLARPDGSMVFSDCSADRDGAALLAAAVALGGDEKDLAIAATLPLPLVKNRSRRSAATLPAATVHSEWAAAAVLRPDWSRAAPRLNVLYPDSSCRVELGCGKDVLWSGQWAIELRVDDVLAAPSSQWDEMCWVSDEDVDYLELAIEFGEKLRVERHFVLARKDRFLLMADAVLASQPATIDYRGTLPLGPNVTFREGRETREGMLVGRKPRAMAMPLALPEWRAEQGRGELTSTGAGLELRQTTHGRTLLAPLFFDLNRSRMVKPLTWRQLTVAESQVVQPADVAVGYRVAIAKQQWLIYRSLAEARNRSVLGHNLLSETLVAQFGRKGQVEPLIEVE